MMLLRITHGGGNYTWNESESAWEESMVGIDDVETGPLAFVLIQLMTPQFLFQVMLASVFSNRSIQWDCRFYKLTNVSAWHMSLEPKLI